MYYEIRIRKGHFNWANPNEVSINHWIGVYNDKDKLIKALNVDDDYYLFSTDAEPEEIIDGLEKYLNSIFLTTQEAEIREMINFLREHSDELLKNKLRKELDYLDKKREKITERLKKLD